MCRSSMCITSKVNEQLYFSDNCFSCSFSESVNSLKISWKYSTNGPFVVDFEASVNLPFTDEAIPKNPLYFSYAINGYATFFFNSRTEVSVFSLILKNLLYERILISPHVLSTNNPRAVMVF